MGVIDRIILSIYTLALMLIFVIVIVMSLGLYSFDVNWTSLLNENIYGHKEVAVVGVIFLMVSLRFFLAGTRTRRQKDSIVHKGQNGSVYITIEAVKNMVEKTARHIKGVRGVKVRVTNANEGLRIKIRAVISPECNVPSVSDDIQQRICDRVKNTVGIELNDVEVIVEDICNDFKGKQRVE